MRLGIKEPGGARWFWHRKPCRLVAMEAEAGEQPTVIYVQLTESDQELACPANDDGLFPDLEYEQVPTV